MASEYNGPNGRIRKSEERQATMAEAAGVTLKGNLGIEDRVGAMKRIKHHVLNVGVLIV